MCGIIVFGNNKQNFFNQKEVVLPEGTMAVNCGDQGVGIGWSYKDGAFVPPPAPEVPKEDLVMQAAQQKTNLIADASQTISILQDAVDLGMTKDEETAELTAWKQYRILLSRVDTSKSPAIGWPAKS
ncbi:tail fiber assembly protein [Pantoea sp.]|uniref:tail fiber assembly protein n=1 Tax=Pantoea sp. TaxID=69393 RepID=UPI0028AA2355|nr:tail fiber assembly protein [Pantoea sp.]